MKKMLLVLFLFVICSLDAAELSLDTAQRMALAAESKAKEMGINVSIAILDQHGNPKVFYRMDGASKGSTVIARLKANTSASFRLSSRRMAENNVNQPNHAYSYFPEVILLPGGLPIQLDGEHVGGIGVSGATGDQDEAVAQAGIDAIHSN